MKSLEIGLGKNPQLMIVADDFGLHPGVNEGIFRAAERNAITGTDVMLPKPYARRGVRRLQEEFPHVGIGLHVVTFPELPGIAEDNLIFKLRGLQDPSEALVKPLVSKTREQIRDYQDLMGVNPPHISTHNHAHHDLEWNIFKPFIDVIGEETDGSSAVIVRGRDTQLIRHASATNLKNGVPPIKPDAFQALIEPLLDTQLPPELGVHPGVEEASDEPIDSDFPLDLREIDLKGLMTIFDADVIQNVGFKPVNFAEFIRQ